MVGFSLCSLLPFFLLLSCGEINPINRVEIVTSLRNKKILNVLKTPLKTFFYVYPFIFLIGLLFDRIFPRYGIQYIFIGIIAAVTFAQALIFGFFGIKVFFSSLKKTRLLNFSFPQVLLLLSNNPNQTTQSSKEFRVITTLSSPNWKCS